jgi:hypothetical protein
MKKNSKTGSMTQLTDHYIGSLRVRAYAHIGKECFLASFVSDLVSKPGVAGFDIPAANPNISFLGAA